MDQLKDCHDCGVNPGQLHAPGCDVERCPRCGSQAISCGCIYEVCGMDIDDLPDDIYRNGPTDEMYARWNDEWGSRRMPWSGIWPGVLECREYGLWAKLVDGAWVTCDKDDPEATEDLNTLYCLGEWDQQKQRMVVPKH